MPATTPLATGDAAAWRAADFSLVLGGPLYQALRRVRLTDDVLGLLHRRIIAAGLIAWAPLLVLSALEGGLFGPSPKMPFLTDIGFHVRFLVVVPLLLAAEVFVHRRLQPIVDQFRVRNLVRPDETERFADAVNEALRWRNSIVPELVLLGFIYAAGILFNVHRYVAMGPDAWFGAPAGKGVSVAGLWLVFVSLPLFQFLLLRWYFRLLIWAKFLWRMSRLDLDLNATHPDRAGGLGFLGASMNAFVPIAAAHGALSAGVMANRIFFGGARLTDFQLEVLGEAVFLIALFAGPLTVFAWVLARVKRRGLREFGALGQIYVRDFRAKWFAGAPPKDEPLIGSADIQSLADLGNSFASAQQMRFAPIGPTGLLYFGLAFIGPILPLVLTLMPLDALIARMVGIVF
ncbi:hypothetical protein LJR219_000268 [Phenylobacterium sp. LjRoot219]|uniref:hypothetical protein n=1 Tax=Phenylobacterium sp. LjRoot219 TaxID=3342283 RepID=UPI003ECDF71E